MNRDNVARESQKCRLNRCRGLFKNGKDGAVSHHVENFGQPFRQGRAIREVLDDATGSLGETTTHMLRSGKNSFDLSVRCRACTQSVRGGHNGCEGFVAPQFRITSRTQVAHGDAFSPCETRKSGIDTSSCDQTIGDLACCCSTFPIVTKSAVHVTGPPHVNRNYVVVHGLLPWVQRRKLKHATRSEVPMLGVAHGLPGPVGQHLGDIAFELRVVVVTTARITFPHGTVVFLVVNRVRENNLASARCCCHGHQIAVCMHIATRGQHWEAPQLGPSFSRHQHKISSRGVMQVVQALDGDPGIPICFVCAGRRDVTLQTFAMLSTLWSCNPTARRKKPDNTPCRELAVHLCFRK
mmetsp:Transcript_60272/g.130877  ORF Transcript_60272/g.130877 Transcript_60272/m.130877 type:complete len:352 (-) Transcript_60272:374-1429(-)